MPAAFSPLKYPKLVKQDFYQIMISQQVLNKKNFNKSIVKAENNNSTTNPAKIILYLPQSLKTPPFFFNIDILRSFCVSSLLTFSFRTLLQETLHLRRWSSLPWIMAQSTTFPCLLGGSSQEPGQIIIFHQPRFP